jgi:hypothetical protein
LTGRDKIRFLVDDSIVVGQTAFIMPPPVKTLTACGKTSRAVS